MKAFRGSMLAVLIGVALLAGGVAGLAGVFDADEPEPKAGTTTGTSARPRAAAPVACPTPDPRLSGYGTFPLTGEGTDATVQLTCKGGKVNASLFAGQLVADDPRVVALWLYRSRSQASLVAAARQEPGDGIAVVSGVVPPDSSAYPKWVVTLEPADDEKPARPSKAILLQGRIG